MMHKPTARRVAGRGTVTLAVVAVLIAAGITALVTSSPTHPPRLAARSAHATATPPKIIDAAPGWSLIATLKAAADTYTGPGGHSDGMIPATWYGAPSALPVIAQSPGWLQVRLPTRPNQSVAWVRAADTTVSSTPYRIEVDLTTRRLELLEQGTVVLDAPAGIGAADDPTPAGAYFVAFFEQAPNPGYGPFILVTTAHSNSIQDWQGSGDALIGIHGPLGDDALIGTTGAAVSHGCIRLHDNDLERLRQVPAGTPITINA